MINKITKPTTLIPPLYAWKFSPQLDEERRARLESVVSFESILDRIAEEIRDIRLNVCHGKDPGLTDSRRPVFSFEVNQDTFDAFFNIPVGYRAQYLLDPEAGQAANGHLVRRLAGKLIAVVPNANADPELLQSEVEMSLLAASAKVWVHEDYFPFQSLTVDLAVATWLAEAKAGIQKAKWGLCAPRCSMLQIKGAFIDHWGNEVVPNNKIGRRLEIQKYGFS